jgi:hypothetical protein
LFPRRSATLEWKGAIAQPGLSEYSFGAAGEENFYGQATTSPLLNAAPSTPRARGSEREREAQPIKHPHVVVVLLLRVSQHMAYIT